MPTYHLGVKDVPYNKDKQSEEVKQAFAKKNFKKPLNKESSSSADTVTTGEVAQWLENKYHVMEIYSEVHPDVIAKDISEIFELQIESVMMDSPLEAGYQPEQSEVMEDFKKFLSSGEIETLGYPGVPTKAAKDRVSARFKSGKNLEQRPSFIDTGLYQASFTAWIDDKNADD